MQNILLYEFLKLSDMKVKKCYHNFSTPAAFSNFFSFSPTVLGNCEDNKC